MIKRLFGVRFAILSGALGGVALAQGGVTPYLDLGGSALVAPYDWNPGDLDGDGFADAVCVRAVPLATPADPQHLYVLAGPDGGVLLDITPSFAGAWTFV